jgi:hypothetical protein
MFPAFFDLISDDAIVAHPTAIRVWAVLARNPLILYEPQRVPAWHLADTLHVERNTASRCLALLIARGYVIEHVNGRPRFDDRTGQYDSARYVTIAAVRRDVPHGVPHGEGCQNAPTHPARRRDVA